MIKKEITRFLMVGTLVNATDFGIYYLLFHFLPFSIAKGTSFICAGVVGYLLNKHWTFNHKQTSRGQALRYVLINSLSLGINVFTNQYILNGWPHAILPALITASFLTALFTFICFKWWVF